MLAITGEGYLVDNLCWINTAEDCPLDSNRYILLIPCPYAAWTIWCDDGKKCEKCPVKKARE